MKNTAQKFLIIGSLLCIVTSFHLEAARANGRSRRSSGHTEASSSHHIGSGGTRLGTGRSATAIRSPGRARSQQRYAQGQYNHGNHPRNNNVNVNNAGYGRGGYGYSGWAVPGALVGGAVLGTALATGYNRGYGDTYIHEYPAQPAPAEIYDDYDYDYDNPYNYVYNSYNNASLQNIPSNTSPAVQGTYRNEPSITNTQVAQQEYEQGLHYDTQQRRGMHYEPMLNQERPGVRSQQVLPASSSPQVGLSQTAATNPWLATTRRNYNNSNTAQGQASQQLNTNSTHRQPAIQADMD